MEGDIKSVQTGQAPKSVEVKPPIFQAELPKPHPSSLPTPAGLTPLPGSKSLPPTGSSKPSLPPPHPPIEVKLGEAQKRTSLPSNQGKLPTPLPAGPISLPSVGKPELKTPESKVIPPAALVARSLSAGETGQGGISIPSGGSIFTNIFANKRLMALVGVGLLVLLGGVLFLRRGSGPEDDTGSTPTFSASPTVSSSSGLPVSSTLSSIFKDHASLYVPANSQDELIGLQSEAVFLSNNSFEQNVLVSVKNARGVNYEFDDFLEHFLISFPVNLTSHVDNNDFSLILTKQTEFFNQTGELTASPSAESLLKPKMALTVRVTDALEANGQLISWEDTFIDSLKEFYGLPSQFGDLRFSDSTYQGAQIRFVNFPFPDKAIDYGIITAKNGNDYLVIANSRQQMYSVIDKLLGF